MVELQGQGSGPQHCFAAPLAPLEQPLSLFPLSGFHSNHVACTVRFEIQQHNLHELLEKRK